MQDDQAASTAVSVCQCAGSNYVPRHGRLDAASCTTTEVRAQAAYLDVDDPHDDAGSAETALRDKQSVSSRPGRSSTRHGRLARRSTEQTVRGVLQEVDDWAAWTRSRSVSRRRAGSSCIPDMDDQQHRADSATAEAAAGSSSTRMTRLLRQQSVSFARRIKPHTSTWTARHCVMHHDRDEGCRARVRVREGRGRRRFKRTCPAGSTAHLSHYSLLGLAWARPMFGRHASCVTTRARSLLDTER